MSTFVYPPVPVAISTAGLATEATLLLVETNTAATATNTNATNLELASIDFSTETTLAALSAKVPAGLTVTSSRLDVDATQSGTWTVKKAGYSPVQQISGTPLLDTSSTNIPASSGSPVEIIASTSSAVNSLVSVEDIGSFIGLYTGAAASEVLLVVLPLGGGQIDVAIPAATRLSLRAMQNTAITSGSIAINFLS